MLKNISQSIEELVCSYKDSPEGRKKEALRLLVVEAGMPLVKKAVFRLCLRDATLQEDLIQIGALGLMKAIDSYDVNKNASFSTYAYYHIRGNIGHYLRDKVDYVRTPRNVKELIYKVSDTYEQLKAAGETNITPERLSEALNVDQDKILDIMSMPATKQFVSIEQLSGFDEEDIALVEKISDEERDDFAVSYDNQSVIKEAFDELPEDMQKAIKMSFYEEYNQREIAERMSISQMQVSRLIKRALLLMYDSIKTRI